MISDMPRPRKPYLHRDVDRHGNVRWYFRRAPGAPKIRIRGEFGSAEFESAYAAAYADAPVVQKAAGNASLRWLVDRWRESSDWSLTAKSTRRQRDNIVVHILAANGDLPFAAITTDDIRAGRERRKDTPFAANNYLKTMRALFRWAKEIDAVKADPTDGVKLLVRATEGHKPWTDADLAAYRSRWSVGTRERLAMELLYWTGLRRGDVVTLGRQHIGRDGMARITAEKTGHRVAVLMPAHLMEIVDASPTGSLTFIVGESGNPLSKESFGNMFRKWCKSAGVNASAHGLRKIAATEAAEAGAADQQLDAMFGWQTPEMSRTYTRAARQDVLAKEAQEKRVKNILYPHPDTGGDISKKSPNKSGA